MNKQQQRWRAVGKAVKARYKALGMLQADLERESGLSDATIRKIEEAEITTRGPRTSTKRQLEAALKWAPGSIDAILAGREPTLLDGAEAPVDANDLRAMVIEVAQTVVALAGRVEAIERRLR